MPPLSPGAAKVRLNRCLADGTVVYSRHFWEELANDGLTILDVRAACRRGEIVRPPEPDLRTGDWKYRIEGVVEKTRIAVVFCFRRETQAVFITVFKDV